MTIIYGVISGVLVLLIGWAAKWLSSEVHREELRERIPQLFCVHDWQPIDDHGPFVRVTTDSDECVKCGARR